MSVPTTEAKHNHIEAAHYWLGVDSPDPGTSAAGLTEALLAVAEALATTEAAERAEARVLLDADPVLAEVVGHVEDRIKAVTAALLATADNDDVRPEDQPCWCPEKGGLPDHEYAVCQQARAALATPPASDATCDGYCIRAVDGPDPFCSLHGAPPASDAVGAEA